MRRCVILLVAALMAVAGCVDAPDAGGRPDAPAPGGDGPATAAFVPQSLVADDGTVRLVEVYDGVVVAANVGVLVLSPDQLGQVDREFYVHHGTNNITLYMVADGELTMHIMDPTCHDLGCAEAVDTQGGQLVHVVDEPAVGNWEVVFFKRDPGAAEVDYVLSLTKQQGYLHAAEEENYTGDVVAAHTGAIRISPDQLGDVYREFWVHEGVLNLTVEVAASEDFYFVLGQSDRGRDSDSEEGWVTQGRSLTLHFDGPQVGGWYMIFFHHPDGPGVEQIEYAVEVTKDR